MSHLKNGIKPETDVSARGRAIFPIFHNPPWYFTLIIIVFLSVKEIYYSGFCGVFINAT